VGHRTPAKRGAKGSTPLRSPTVRGSTLRSPKVEFFSSVVHPFPADFDGNIPAHVRRYPDWVLAVVVLMWGAAAAAATWVASRIGGRLAGALVTLLLASALAFNLSMLPYVMWFKAAMPAAFFVACLLGIRTGTRSR